MSHYMKLCLIGKAKTKVLKLFLKREKNIARFPFFHTIVIIEKNTIKCFQETITTIATLKILLLSH